MNGWMHDEIAGWVSTDGEEMEGLLEERWMKYDDSRDKGTEWIDEKGMEVKLRKGGFINISKVITDKYYNLLPEYYLRQSEPNFIELSELNNEVKKISAIFKK
jgi:hypothetical protein